MIIDVGVRWNTPVTLCGEPAAATTTLVLHMESDDVDNDGQPGSLLEAATKCERCGTPLRRSRRLDMASKAGLLAPPAGWWEAPVDPTSPDDEVDTVVLAHDAARCRAVAS